MSFLFLSMMSHSEADGIREISVASDEVITICILDDVIIRLAQLGIQVRHRWSNMLTADTALGINL